jgi:DNA-binding transcriptional ArsR family regulator
MTTEKLLMYFKVLGNETRLKILGLIADREMSVGTISQQLKLTEPTISHHLAKLAEVDLVRLRVDGTSHYYALNKEALYESNRLHASLAKMGQPARVTVNDDAEQKILNTFIVNGRLTKIPQMEKKRVVILKWLADKLEMGRQYQEKEINVFLKLYHEDYATLRREMVNSRIVARDNGVYWRL